MNFLQNRVNLLIRPLLIICDSLAILFETSFGHVSIIEFASKMWKLLILMVAYRDNTIRLIKYNGKTVFITQIIARIGERVSLNVVSDEFLHIFI